MEGKPQWVQPLVEAGSEAAAALKQEEAANMTHAVAAAQMAQEVGGRVRAVSQVGVGVWVGE